MLLMKNILQLFDWVCQSNKFIFIFNEEHGRANLNFLVKTCDKILAQFRAPLLADASPEWTFNNKNDQPIFPFIEIGALL